MEPWFKKAKLGIFLHWGIYAVDGIAESWSFGLGDISYDDYMKQLDGFTAENYDPTEWAKIFKECGANYVVLTAKHHDGVALFDTKYSDLNVVKKSPAKRDLIAPYCKAMRDAGLKTGLYFTNTDWSDIDNMCVVLDKTEEEIKEFQKVKTSYNTYWSAVLMRETDVVTDELTQRWERFIKLYQGQIEELLTHYGDIDLLWFDIMLARQGYSWHAKETRELIRKLNPHTVVNGRLGDYGDYETPENYIPLTPNENPWEMCLTLNDSWGYRYNDSNFKSVQQIARIFVECISKGGNMLISLGPDKTGKIGKDYTERMLEFGKWTKKYYEAIYPTDIGLEPEYFLGGSTLSEDRKTLYLFAFDVSSDKLMLNGILNKDFKVTNLKNNKELNYMILGGAPWIKMSGTIWIDIDPAEDVDDVCTVLKIEFNEEIDLVELKRKVKSVGEIENL